MRTSDERFWEGRPVLVTGATGWLVGGWQVAALIEAGALVTALVRNPSRDCQFFRDRTDRQARIVTGDLLDPDLLRRSFADHSIDTVFHLAGQPLVNVAKADPVGTLEVNVRGTWMLLEAARQTGVRQVIVASSDKAYGAPAYLPYNESHPLQGKFPYDVSKSCADLICGMYASTYGLPVCVTRTGNLFGGGDLNFSRTIPGIIRAAFENKPFEIRSDGQYVRDFLYVRDAVTANMVVAERLARNPALAGECFNFSLEVRLTVLEMVRLVLTLLGSEHLAPVIHNTAASEVREQYLTAEKAKAILAWAPAFSLREGLLETIAWYRSYFQSGVSASAVVGVA